MIYFLIPLAIVAALMFVYFLYTSVVSKISHIASAKIVERELTRIMTQADAEKHNLPDPNRALTDDDKQKALKHIYDLGNH